MKKNNLAGIDLMEHFIGKSFSETIMLIKNKGFEYLSDSDLNNNIFSLQNLFFDKYGGKRYKTEAKELDNLINVLLSERLRRGCVRIGFKECDIK